MMYYSYACIWYALSLKMLLELWASRMSCTVIMVSVFSMIPGHTLCSSCRAVIRPSDVGIAVINRQGVKEKARRWKVGTVLAKNRHDNASRRLAALMKLLPGKCQARQGAPLGWYVPLSLLALRMTGHGSAGQSCNASSQRGV